MSVRILFILVALMMLVPPSRADSGSEAEASQNPAECPRVADSNNDSSEAKTSEASSNTAPRKIAGVLGLGAKPLILPPPRDELRSTSFDEDAHQLAQQLGVEDQITALSRERDAIKAGKAPSVDYIFRKQELLETVLNASLEVRAVSSRLMSEIAETDDLQALLEERRDRAVRLNTMANFISGGITGIIGGSMNLGHLVTTPSDSIDLAEGVVQTSLATYAFKQQDGEKRFVRGVPNMLARIFGLPGAHEYPDTVWRFLNSAPTGSTTTRREQLLNRWKNYGVIERIKSRPERNTMNTRIAHVTGSHPNHPVTIDLLSTRSAMLSDLQAMIGQMDAILLRLLQMIRG